MKSRFRSFTLITALASAIVACQSTPSPQQPLPAPPPSAAAVTPTTASPVAPATPSTAQIHATAYRAQLHLSSESSCSQSWSNSTYQGAVALDLTRAPEATLSLTLAHSNVSGGWGDPADTSRYSQPAETCQWTGVARPIGDRGEWQIDLTLTTPGDVASAPYTCLDVQMDRTRPAVFSMTCDSAVADPAWDLAPRPLSGPMDATELLRCALPLDAPYALRLATPAGFTGIGHLFLSDDIPVQVRTSTGSWDDDWSLQGVIQYPDE